MSTDEVHEFILRGEGQELEFKSSMRFDFATQQVNRDLAKVVPKTLAAFFNSSGGTLLIGVDDNGDVVGIGADINTLSRKTADYYELTIRNCIGKHLGVTQSAATSIEFVPSHGQLVARIDCSPSRDPVYFQDGEKREFYIRDGNASRPLNVKESHSYIQHRFRSEIRIPEPDVQRIAEAVVLRLSGAAPDDQEPGMPVRGDSPSVGTANSAILQSRLQELSAELGILSKAIKTESAGSTALERPESAHPAWLKVATVRVIDTFLKQLADAVGWKRIFLVSPWISEVTSSRTLSFSALLQRINEDKATVYVVTRPPNLDWHKRAVSMLADTGRANIVYVENMHAKLYTALTNTGRFALLGSANFTERSLEAEEIGVLVNAFMQGKQVISRLDREAERIYRTPGRTLAYKAKFDVAG
ncbi:RNA-binding domain-containing protein [Wenzhouxiangella sp. XN24]|uniref:RNA-binding domain-containing protein n=1 Tax=Wenzhouxiangella sp. XN24 TaxID=2713569 RepID=UPI0013EDD052|nr:RNA-binding domain-containing protein [Wenzhouxiangella sp. XN24]NGX16024.1 hypothetical protein [Wenzhouxiangella sp. XN24]